MSQTGKEEVHLGKWDLGEVHPFWRVRKENLPDGGSIWQESDVWICKIATRPQEFKSQ